MAWCYQILGSENRLVEIRCGFRTATEAHNAGQRAKRMIHSICHPNLEPLTLVTEEKAST
jgi:hypothetical protein